MLLQILQSFQICDSLWDINIMVFNQFHIFNCLKVYRALFIKPFGLSFSWVLTSSTFNGRDVTTDLQSFQTCDSMGGANINGVKKNAL